MDGGMGNGGDMFRINPMIDEVVIANIEVVDHRGVIVNLRYLRWSAAQSDVGAGRKNGRSAQT